MLGIMSTDKILYNIYDRALTYRFTDKAAITRLKNIFRSFDSSENKFNSSENTHPDVKDSDIKFNYANTDYLEGDLNDKKESQLHRLFSRRIRRRIPKEFSITKEVRNLSRNDRTKKSKKKTVNKFITPINLPWVDLSLWSTISSVRPKTLPDSKPTISRSEIYDKDKTVCENFLSHNNSIGNSWFSCFSLAACHSAQRIGLISYTKRSKFNLLTVTESIEVTSKNTNSGAPLMVKKNSPENIKWMKTTMRDLFMRPTKYKFLNLFTNGLKFSDKTFKQALFELPQRLFRRFQIDTSDFKQSGEFKIKPRVVWCVPHIVVALEAFFMHSALENCKFRSIESNRFPYSISQNNRMISNSLSALRSDNCNLHSDFKLFSLDYSKYDQTIPLWFIDIFYSIIREGLELTTNEEKIFNDLRLYTKHTPMIYNDTIQFKERGISSGLFITNFFDSVFNMTLLKVVEIIREEYPEYFINILSQEEHKSRNFLFDKRIFKDVRSILSVDKDNFRVLGDDGIIVWTHQNINFLKKLCFFLKMELKIKGITENIAEDSIFYLGRFWNKKNIPDQTFEYMSGHIVFRSKFYNKKNIDFDIKDLECHRILSICLPLASGAKYIKTFFSNYEPLVNFIKQKKTFYLLKEWPYDNYLKFENGNIPLDPLDY